MTASWFPRLFHSLEQQLVGKASKEEQRLEEETVLALFRQEAAKGGGYSRGGWNAEVDLHGNGRQRAGLLQ